MPPGCSYCWASCNHKPDLPSSQPLRSANRLHWAVPAPWHSTGRHRRRQGPGTAAGSSARQGGGAANMGWVCELWLATVVPVQQAGSAADEAAGPVTNGRIARRQRRRRAGASRFRGADDGLGWPRSRPWAPQSRAHGSARSSARGSVVADSPRPCPALQPGWRTHGPPGRPPGWPCEAPAEAFCSG